MISQRAKVIPVQFFDRSAQLQLRLPQTGPMWFVVNDTMTVEGFLEQCKRDDESIKTIDILKESGKFESMKSTKVVKTLESVDQKKTLMELLHENSEESETVIEINGHQFRLPVTKDPNMDFKSFVEENWYEIAVKEFGIPKSQAAVINLAIQNLEQNKS